MTTTAHAGRHRRPEFIHYATCPGCGHEFRFDADKLRDDVPTAFAFGDIVGALPDVEWLPVEVLAVAEGAVEEHEQKCGAA